MTNDVGPLGDADELFCHQIPETFGSVGTSELSWTEKVCAMTAARDGSLQLGFGLGKYTNRNVMDGYAGISRGREQVTVRASRRLSPSPDATQIGPIRYEVLDPMRVVRFSLERNPCQSIAFEWTFEAAIPAAAEQRTHQRSTSGYRVSADLVRYHQIGVASGWVEIDGDRSEFGARDWVSTRDHSWGVRYDVGKALVDLEPGFGLEIPGVRFLMLWAPVLMERPNGSRYGLFLHLVHTEAPGFLHRTVTGGVEAPDGAVDAWTDLVPSLRFDPRNRRLLGGTIDATTADGARRTIELEVLGDTGFHLGTGLYFGWRGEHHGAWRGELHVDGERLDDCTDPTLARELHQIRDTVVRLHDPVGGGTGIGNCQPIVTGAWPELDLDEASSFV